jgi:hypothetical protein
MGVRWQYWIRGLMLFGALASGCSEELGPVPRETTRVSGRVRQGAQPIRGGWIEFAPIDGTVGNLRSAPIRPDGTFSADGVAVGKNLIGLAGTPDLDRRQRQFFDTLRSPIRRTIPRGPETSLTIDLVQEAVRGQAGPSSGG